MTYKSFFIAALLLSLMPLTVGAQGTDINSRDLRGKVVYQDDEAELTAYAGANYRCGKWLATFGLQYINNLYTAVGNDETKENFALLDASVTYAATRNISLWARDENLLAQKYEINLGYPMPRATFMGGVNVNF